MQNPLLPLVVNLLIERPARRRSFAELAAALEAGAAPVDARAAAVADTPASRRVLRHIIGLERWGQRRLRVALGEPLVRDEMDAYEPPADATLADLRAAWAETRRQTAALARELEARGVDGAARVEHNQFGPVSARGWLGYLNTHANIESRRLRPS